MPSKAPKLDDVLRQMLATPPAPRVKKAVKKVAKKKGGNKKPA